MNKTVSESFLSNIFFLFAQIQKILFAGKFYIFLILAVVWDVICVILGHVFHDPMPLEAVFYVMNLVPMLILALYLSMTLVSFEKENVTIEALFSVPGSPYKVWLYKLAVQFIMLFFVQMLFAFISFYFVQDFAIEVMVSHVLIPVFCVANLNFFLSTLFKSGYAAGLSTLVVLLFLLLLYGFLSAIPVIDSTYWNFYLSPFEKPGDMDINVWNQKLLYNKAGVLFIGLVFMYFGLSKLRNREPFI